MLALGAGGVGTAAMAVRSLPGAAPAAPGAESSPGEGYRLTDHVKRYYQSTKT